MKWFRDQFLFLVLLNHAEPFHLTYLGNTYSCYDKNVGKLFLYYLLTVQQKKNQQIRIIC